MSNLVVHCKKEPYDVYIGRSSKWGNPFIIGRDGNRETVVRLFRESLTENQREEARRELRGKVLGCWCKPELCHGDVLVEIAIETKEIKIGV